MIECADYAQRPAALRRCGIEACQPNFAPKLNRITEVANMYFTSTIAKPPVGRSNKNEFQRFIYAYTIVINDMQTPSIGLIISLVLANFNFLKYAKEK